MTTRRALDPRDIRMFVLDEADVMLSQGFKDAIYDIFRNLPSDVQVGSVFPSISTSVIQSLPKKYRNNFMLLPNFSNIGFRIST